MSSCGTSPSPSAARTPWRASVLPSATGRFTPWSARTAPASRRSGRSSPGSTRRIDGQLLLAGEPVRFRSPGTRSPAASSLIAQELAIVPSLTVAENVFLGVEPRHAGFQNRRELRRRYTELAASVGFELDGRRQRRQLADGRPAEGRDPARAVPRGPADRDGRADGRAVPAGRESLARGHPPARAVRYHRRARLAFPRRGARARRRGDRAPRRTPRPDRARRRADRGLAAVRDARPVA